MAACTLSALPSSPSLFLFAVLLYSRDEMYFAPRLCLVPSCPMFPPRALTPVPVPMGRSVVALPRCPLHPPVPLAALPHPALPPGFYKNRTNLLVFIYKHSFIGLLPCVLFCTSLLLPALLSAPRSAATSLWVGVLRPFSIGLEAGLGLVVCGCPCMGASPIEGSENQRGFRPAGWRAVSPSPSYSPTHRPNGYLQPSPSPPELQLPAVSRAAGLQLPACTARLSPSRAPAAKPLLRS